MSRVLVTGGAGYIGSHIVRRLVEAGHEPVTIDDLSVGHRAALRGTELCQADFADESALDDLLGGGRIPYIIHMAALCEVGESMKDPAGYYRTNLLRSMTLLDAARRHGVRGIVFSSTAAVYGEPESIPIPEEHPKRPTNPYGETKLAFERALEWYRRSYEIGYVALRYFNAAGAHPDGDIGEDHSPESHLIPRLIGAAGSGAEPMPIFGDDWPTKDGTCVRDYVHVVDLAEAHLLALERIEREPATGGAFNLGNGEGFSVREVADIVGRVVGSPVRTRSAPRRPGDPATLVASSVLAERVLGWKPRFPDLESIVRTAWNWHRANPDGYGDRAPVERATDPH